MDNVVKIPLGSLGSLGGEGNLGNVSIHDSTCLCEGCLEKRLADREFTIRTDNIFGEKDFGFNEGDEDGLDAPGEIIVLSDDDGRESVSDIFDIYNDEPSDDDTGYGDDGQDSEDGYSLFSPRPCYSSEEGESSDDNIEEEDTPTLETAIKDTSIEASKKDGESITNCVEEIDKMEHLTIQHRHLQSVIDTHHVSDDTNHTLDLYETKLMSLFKQLSKYVEVIQAAKRRMDYNAFEIARLRDLGMAKTTEINQKDE